jgi:hypothetical protein
MTDEEKRSLAQQNEERRRQIQSQLANVKTPPIHNVEVDPAVLENQSDPNEVRLAPEERQKLFQTLSEGTLLPENQAPVQAAPQSASPLTAALTGNPAILEAVLKALPPDQLQKLLLAVLTGGAQPQAAPQPAPAPAAATPFLDDANILQETLNSRKVREQETAVAEQTLDTVARQKILEEVSGSDDTIKFIQNMGGFR